MLRRGSHRPAAVLGIGNTVFRRFGEVETRLVSRDGTVGGTMRTPVEETLQLSDGDVIVMSTDGVDFSHFPASAYPRLHTDRARMVAAAAAESRTAPA